MWVENTSESNKDFIENYNEDKDELFSWSWCSMILQSMFSMILQSYLPEMMKIEIIINTELRKNAKK